VEVIARCYNMGTSVRLISCCEREFKSCLGPD
jgi:hypothetical protein